MDASLKHGRNRPEYLPREEQRYVDELHHFRRLWRGGAHGSARSHLHVAGLVHRIGSNTTRCEPMHKIVPANRIRDWQTAQGRRSRRDKANHAHKSNRSAPGTNRPNKSREILRERERERRGEGGRDTCIPADLLQDVAGGVCVWHELCQCVV